MKIFGFDMEFDHNKLRKKIEASKESDTKGYICVIDGPSLARSYKNSAFMELLQNSYAIPVMAALWRLWRRIYARDS